MLGYYIIIKSLLDCICLNILLIHLAKAQQQLGKD